MITHQKMILVEPKGPRRAELIYDTCYVFDLPTQLRLTRGTMKGWDRLHVSLSPTCSEVCNIPLSGSVKVPMLDQSFVAHRNNPTSWGKVILDQ
jgi:hypothetical protein